MTAAGLAVAIPAVLAYNVFGKRGRPHARPSSKASRTTCARWSLDTGRGGRLSCDGLRPPRTHAPAPQPMSDINMTPLIDVMLVLLVIFMITAPLMTSRASSSTCRKTDGGQPSDAPQFIARGARRARASSTSATNAVDAAHLAARVADAARREPAHRGAAARRPGRALRPRRRADRHRAEGRAEPHRVRHRGGAGGRARQRLGRATPAAGASAARALSERQRLMTAEVGRKAWQPGEVSPR